MTKKRGPNTAAELDAELQNNPEFVARSRQREQELADLASRLRIEEEPLLADLREIGWNVNSVWDLVNSSIRYDKAVPILLKHLLLPYSDRTREGIARALAVPEPSVANAWPMLVSEYRKAPIGYESGIRLGAKDGLAVTLSVIAKHTSGHIEEIVDLVKDRSLGSSRLLLLSALRKSKTAVAGEAIEALASDPELAKEISSWKKRHSSRSRP